MSRQANLWDLPSATFSPESGSGHTPSAALDGRMIAPYGPDPALASLSARQAKEKGLLMSDICGPHGSISSFTERAEMYLFLVNKLRLLTVWSGSTLFALTWKTRTTPAGRSICALRASEAPTSGKGFTFWPTPCRQDGPKGGPSQGIDRLPSAAATASWPTPNASNGERSAYADFDKLMARKEAGRQQNLQEVVMMAGWATPKAGDRTNEDIDTKAARNTRHREAGNSKGVGGLTLPMQASLTGWTTPSATDGERGGTVTEKMTGSSLTQQANMLRPDMVGWTTPQAHDSKGRSKTQKEKHGTTHGCACLARESDMAAWPTPTTKDDNMARRSPEAMQREMERENRGTNLALTASLTGWPTPMAHEGRLGYQNRSNGKKGSQESLTTVAVNAVGQRPHLEPSEPARLTVSGEMLTGSDAGMESGGQLNPAHSRWLMGLPSIWDQAAPLKEKAVRKSLKATATP